MKVAVIGPGAIGSLFAAKLHTVGVPVTLVDHKAERAKRRSKEGYALESNGATQTYTVPSEAKVPGDAEMQIVAVKSYSIESLNLLEGVPTLVLSNGLGNIESVCGKVGSANVLCGVTYEAVTRLDEHAFRHVASGLTHVGPWTSCDPMPILEALQRAGFEAELNEAPGQALWEKVIVNGAINPISALTGVPNGDLMKVPELRALVRDLVVESVKVAATEGYRFARSLVEHTEWVCENTASNLSSMLQDIRAGRQTEIEAISGEILRRAELATLACPRTRVVYQLVKGLERI